jgi:hypothetical protein
MSDRLLHDPSAPTRLAIQPGRNRLLYDDQCGCCGGSSECPPPRLAATDFLPNWAWAQQEPGNTADPWTLPINWRVRGSVYSRNRYEGNFDVSGTRTFVSVFPDNLDDWPWNDAVRTSAQWDASNLFLNWLWSRTYLDIQWSTSQQPWLDLFFGVAGPTAQDPGLGLLGPNQSVTQPVMAIYGGFRASFTAMDEMRFAMAYSWADREGKAETDDGNGGGLSDNPIIPIACRCGRVIGIASRLQLETPPQNFKRFDLVVEMTWADGVSGIEDDGACQASEPPPDQSGGDLDLQRSGIPQPPGGVGGLGGCDGCGGGSIQDAMREMMGGDMPV